MLEKELKGLILEKYKSVREFAIAAGLPYTTVDSILKRGVEKANIINIIKICNTLDIDTDELADGEIRPKIKKVMLQLSNSETQHIKKYRELDTHGKKIVDIVLDEEHERCTAVEEEKPEKVPKIEIRSSVYNKASAGTGYMLNDEEWEAIEIPDTYENRQADFALTISGDSMEPIYHDGDIVLVKEQPQIGLGEIGIFIINDEGYIKKYGGDRLISLNNDYDDIKFSEGDYIKCCGKVIGRV